MGRVKLGDVVRLYGFPGTFRVTTEPRESPRLNTRTFVAESLLGQEPRPWWSAVESSVVECNGQPLPLLSAPIAHPAADYPHEPQFQYDDGPESLGVECVAWWHSQRKAVANA